MSRQYTNTALRGSSPLSYLHAKAKVRITKWDSVLRFSSEWEIQGGHHDIGRKYTPTKRFVEDWNIPEIAIGRMLYTIFSW